MHFLDKQQHYLGKVECEVVKNIKGYEKKNQCVKLHGIVITNCETNARKQIYDAIEFRSTH